MGQMGRDWAEAGQKLGKAGHRLGTGWAGTGRQRPS